MRDIKRFAGAATMAAVVLLWGSQAFAQGIDHSIDESDSQSGANRDSTDRSFIQSAYKAGMVQIQMGKVALQKSSNDQVKKFAQTMIDDHGRLDDELKPIAEKHGVKLDTEISKRDQKNIDKFSALSGSAFDQAYIKEEVKAHKSLKSVYYDELNSIKNAPKYGENVDPYLGEAVTSGGHTIDAHLEMAQQLAKGQDVK